MMLYLKWKVALRKAERLFTSIYSLVVFQTFQYQVNLLESLLLHEIHFLF